MRSELPVCKRCCFCLPLRYGLIFWGYLKIMFSGFLVLEMGTSLYFLITYNMSSKDPEAKIPVHMIVLAGLVTLVTTTDIILSITFIVGCHMKNVKLMKIYYVHSVTFLVLMTVTMLYNTVIYIYYLHTYMSYDILKTISYDVLELMLVFAYFAVQGYMILLVRSEMIKLNNGCQFRFVNNAEAAQCTLSVEQETVDNEKNNSRVDNDDEIKIYV